jgi:hypothetical protein
MTKSVYILLSTLFLQSCFLFEQPEPVDKDTLPSFDSNPAIFPLVPGNVDEASGIVDSRNMDNTLWVAEDSDNKAGLDLISHSGQYIRKVTFNGTNRDWEDIAIGPGPVDNKSYLYVGDIGDNNAVYPEYYIYRFPEPVAGQTSVDTYDKITFTYSDKNSYDSETLLLDPLTKDLYILTKRQLFVNLFKLPYPQTTDKPMVAEFVKAVPYSLLTGGDISSDGQEILLRNYNAIYYIKRRTSETLVDALSRNHDLVAPYKEEPQGEGVCFDKENKGYFTISEKAQASSVNLYYFKKK